MRNLSQTRQREVGKVSAWPLPGYNLLGPTGDGSTCSKGGIALERIGFLASTVPSVDMTFEDVNLTPDDLNLQSEDDNLGYVHDYLSSKDDNLPSEDDNLGYVDDYLTSEDGNLTSRDDNFEASRG